MKLRLTFILFAAALSYAQFSSGVDYSVKEQVILDEAGAVFHFENNETEWKTGYSAGKNLTARSEMLSYGYGFFGCNNYDDVVFSYRADHLFRNMSSTARIDTLSVSDSIIVTNYDFDDITFQDIDAEAGLYYKNTYGFFTKARYFSFDETNDTAVQYGARAEYSHEFISGKNILLSLEINSSGNEKRMKGLLSLAEINAQHIIHAAFSAPYENSELELGLSYFGYDDSLIDDKEKEYLKAELRYTRSFKNANTSIYASLGTNLTSDFKTPDIYLPFFYNSVELVNKLMNDRFDLTVGWKYEVYSAVLSDRPDIMSVVPSEDSDLDISETAPYNKFYVKIGFFY